MILYIDPEIANERGGELGIGEDGSLWYCHADGVWRRDRGELVMDGTDIGEKAREAITAARAAMTVVGDEFASAGLERTADGLWFVLVASGPDPDEPVTDAVELEPTEARALASLLFDMADEADQHNAELTAA